MPTSSTPCHETLDLPYTMMGYVIIGGWLGVGRSVVLAPEMGCSGLQNGVQACQGSVDRRLNDLVLSGGVRYIDGA